MTFSQKSAVKKHLAQGLKKTLYLPPTHPDILAAKVEQEPAAAADNTVTSRNNRHAVLVNKLPQLM